MVASSRSPSGGSAWPPGPVRPELSPGVVQVWRSALEPDPRRRAAFEPLLSEGERDRAARFRFPHDAHRYVIARGLLRSLLGRYHDRAPESIRLHETGHGRPFDPDGPDDFDFNLSHSGDRVLLAFSRGARGARGGRVGVDVEQHTRLPDMAEIVSSHFSPAEQATWRELPAGARETAFFACWTRKEAFVKAVGEGLSHPLDAFDVSFAADADPALLRLAGGDPARWSLRALDVGPGYSGALAVETPRALVEQLAI